MLSENRQTVLIVEDDEGIAALEQLQLERAGFAVLTAGTADEALERLRRDRVHLVLLDYCLAGDVDGLDFHAQMKEAGFDLPVILVTGFSNESLAIRALRAGVRDFVTKSTEYLEYLPEAVSRALKQVHTEEALLAERNLLRTLIDALPDIVYTIDTAGRFILSNRAALHHIGLTREEELNGKTVFHVLPRAVAELGQADDQRVLSGGAVVNSEVSFPDATGQLRHFLAIKVPLRDPSGTITGLVGINRDVTERKRAEETLLERGRLTALSADVGLALTTTERLQDTLQRCADALVSNLQGAFARIWTFNEAENILELQASAGIYTHIDGPHRRVPLGQFKIGLIAQERRPHLTNDVVTDPRLSDPDWARREGMVAFAGYPLLMEDRLVGVMAMFARTPLSPSTLDAMAAVAIQIALGIQRKQIEESRNLFRELLDRSNDAIEVIDLETGRFIDANEKAWRSLGFSREEFLALSVPDIAPVAEGLSWHERTAELRRSGFMVLETNHRRKDGSVFPVEINAKLVHLNRAYSVAVVRDITERRRAAIASHQQQARLEGIVNSAMDGIITIDEDQRVILINAAAERMFGCRSDKVIGKCMDCFIPERFRARHAEHVREFGRTGVAARAMGAFGPISGLRADGEEFPIEASISQIQVEGRKLFTVTCRDVTERARAEETRRKLEAQLLQSQKMEAFGQLAGGVAHDFNNLLTIISGYSDILLTLLPVSDPKRNSVMAISEAGSRAAALTRQLLAFSRQTVLEPKVLDLNAVVRETEKMLRRLIGEDILLTALLDPSIRQIKADPGLLGQVLMNLAVNARDAMPQGGKLSIETGNVELDARFPQATPDFKPGWYLLLAVSDTGCGMTPDVKARIFEPFFTTKGVGKGTGLGLAVVHGIVSQSGGHIEIESEPGRGTTFKIYLPAIEERVSPRETVEANTQLRGKETILLVEDEEGVRGLYSLVLQSYGYQMLVAQDGKDALRVVGLHQGGIDLLLTDVVMPHMGGREIAEALRFRFPGMKALFMSGYTDDAVVRHGLEQGRVPFLQKPATPLQLASKVRSVLDSAS